MERRKSSLDKENKRRLNPAEKPSDTSPSERLQKSRDSHLIGSGINPREWSDQQVSTNETAPSSVERQKTPSHDTQPSLKHETDRDPSQNERQAMTTSSDGDSDHSRTQDRSGKCQLSAQEVEQLRKWLKTIPLDEYGHRAPKTIELTSVATRDRPVLVGGMKSTLKDLLKWESREKGESSYGDQRREADRWIGQRLGNYKLVEYLREDSISLAYRGERSKKTVEVKVLKERYKDNQEIVKQFHKEVETLRSLNHPHIVRGLESHRVSLTNRVDYLVMEYVPKGTLRDIYPQDTDSRWSSESVSLGSSSR